MKRAFFVFLAILFFGGFVIPVSSANNQEYSIKAAFIYNFIKFVEWPKDDCPELCLCIYGKDPFGKVIDSLEGKVVKGKIIRVLRIPENAPLSHCDVLFLSAEEKDHQEKVLSLCSESPTLTIGETKDFLEQGGIIKFILLNNKIRFEINATQAKRIGLKLSSKLLRLAKKVK